MNEPSGVLVIDKPEGPTSHAVVARVRRATGLKRVGHTGTLDPAATGVLALVLGRATRLAQFFAGREKEYEAEVRLGRVTDTYDAVGQFSETSPSARADACRVTRSDVEAVLQGFTGTFDQMPPPFSAKKVAGVRAYDLARRALVPDLKPAQVTVHGLELLDVRSGTDGRGLDEAPRIRLRLTCSAGFYVRTLAHEMGARLGCGAWLHRLRRVRSGDFTIADAKGLDEVERLGPTSLDWLLPLERLLPTVPAVVLNEGGVRRALHGNDLAAEHVAGAGSEAGAPRVRLLDEHGMLLGIAEPVPAGGLLHPVIILM